MIKELQKDLEPLLAAHAGATGLFLSGGSDSLLILLTLLDMKATFSIVSFDYSFTRQQQQVIDGLIERHGLRVFSYPPAALYFIGKGNAVSLVEEYALPDRSTLPFVRDCEQDDSKCIYDEVFENRPQTIAPIGFTLNLLGTRKHDRHYAGRPAPAKETQKGGLTFYRPLWDMTRKDVKAGLKQLGARTPKVDTGSYPLCTRCMTAKGLVMCPKIDEPVTPFNWHPEQMLGAFRQKFGFVK